MGRPQVFFINDPFWGTLIDENPNLHNEQPVEWEIDRMVASIHSSMD